MNTKYVMTTAGQFIMANEDTGLQHVELARMMRVSKIASAGFVYFDEGVFRVYGRSIGLDIACSLFAADAMNRALREGELRIKDIREGEAFVATNFDGEPVDAPDILIERKIIH